MDSRTLTQPKISFWDLERRSSRAITLLALILGLYWSAGCLLLGHIAGFLFRIFFMGAVSLRFSPAVYVMLLLGGFAAAAVHWFWATRSVIDRTLRIFDVKDLDPQDPYHKVFRNTVEEISIASGNRIRVRCVVIPCASLNGFAMRDPQDRAVVGITEGMLARTKRNELQAVVAQLTGQVLSCDALVNTVAFSLFGALQEAFDKLQAGGALGAGSGGIGPTGAPAAALLGRGSSRAAGGLAALAVRLFLGLGYLLNTALSRQRVFRSDALAVQLTRDPLGLALALRRLKSAWRGSGTFGAQTEAILFAPPGRGRHDTSMGFFRSLFSAHPPLEERFRRVLAMAGTTEKRIEELLKKKAAPRAVALTETRRTATRPADELWHVYLDGRWQGPFTLAALAALPQFGAQMLVSRAALGAVVPAGEDPLLKQEFFDKKLRSGTLCPRCQVQLGRASYEGVAVHSCPACGGRLVPFDGMQRILVRRLLPLSEEIRNKARRWKEQVPYRPRTQGSEDEPEKLTCPQCKNPMTRGFYNPEYFIEVDRCYVCGLIWFDAGELELLQALVEQKSAFLYEEDPQR